MASYFKNTYYSYNEIFDQINNGDLVEIDRGRYKHWAICEKNAGENSVRCFHVTNTTRDENSPPANNENNIQINTAFIRSGTLLDILGETGKCRVNNQKAKFNKLNIAEVPDINKVLKNLEGRIGESVEYDPQTNNCEHYATFWKYGIGFSEHPYKFRGLINRCTAGLTGCGAATSGGAASLGFAGFTSSGIAGGSIAAGIQSSIGNVAAGSVFATVQSAGATGLIASVGTGAGIITAPIALVGGAYYFSTRNNQICEE